MKTKTLTPKLLAAAAAGSLFLSGCFRDDSPTSNNGSSANATLEGRVQGDAALMKGAGAGAGVEGAVVTVAQLNSDGSLRTVSTAEAKTDAQGRFSVQTAADGARELIVSAKKEGKEWKAVVSAKAEKGKAIACRPLNLESSLEADVFAKARGEAKAGEVSFVDIASKIDAEVAATAEAKASAKADFEAYLSAQAQTEAKARLEALIHGTAKATQAQIDKAEEARMEAQAKLEADLDASLDFSAEARAKLDADFKQAEHKAWMDAGLALDAVTAARESCFTAMIKGSEQVTVDAEEKGLWIRKISLEHASQLEIAVEENVKAKGGSDTQLKAAVAAGTALEASLNLVKTEVAADSEFIRFRSACAAGKIEIPGIVAHADNGGSFTLSGKVDGGVSGADVQVATVKADGSLEIMSGVKGTTDAQGGFTLTSDTKLPDSLVVVVSHADEKLMVYVDSSTKAPVQVNNETTVETQIVQQAAKEGKTDVVTAVDVKAKVDSATAAEVKGNDTAMAHILTGLEIAAKAQGNLLVTAGLSASDSAVAKARSLELYAQALAKFTTDLSADAKFRLVKSAHASACASLRIAAEGSAKAAGASDASLKALAEAGAALQASVEASANAEAIASAYDTYHASVTACLKAALVLQASAVEKADAAIRAADGARAELMAKLAAAADAEAAAKAQVDFAAKVEATVNASFGTGLGAPGAVQLKAITHALVLANMCG